MINRLKDIRKDYPSLFLDTPAIKEQRKKSQKQYYKADYFTFFTYRKISIYISLIFIKLGIRAVTITYFSILTYIFLMLVMVIFPQLSSIWLVAFLWHFGYFLDVIDGEIARLSNKTSQTGERLDNYIFLLSIVSFYYYIYLQLNAQNNHYFSALIMFLLACDIFFNIKKVSNTKHQFDITRFSALRSLILKFAFIKPGMLICIPLIINLEFHDHLISFIMFVLSVNFAWTLKKLVNYVG